MQEIGVGDTVGASLNSPNKLRFGMGVVTAVTDGVVTVRVQGAARGRVIICHVQRPAESLVVVLTAYEKEPHPVTGRARWASPGF